LRKGLIILAPRVCINVGGTGLCGLSFVGSSSVVEVDERTVPGGGTVGIAGDTHTVDGDGAGTGGGGFLVLSFINGKGTAEGGRGGAEGGGVGT